MLSLTTYMTTACCALSSNLMALPYRIYHLTTECSSFLPDISIAPLQVHYYSEALPTTALILCWSYHAKALHATVSERLAQGRYLVARVGFKPATFRTQGTKLTTEPQRLTHSC